MGSKAFLFLGLFLAIFLMISSEAVARELTETSNLDGAMKSDNEKDEGDVYNGGRKPCNYAHRCKRCRKGNGCK